MNKSFKNHFLYPSKASIVIFIFLLFIFWAGSVQSWAFNGKEMGIPKPMFYDTLQFFPFWGVVAIIALPLLFVSNIVKMALQIESPLMESPVFICISVVYCYLLSCLSLMFYKKFTGSYERKTNK